MNRGDAHQLPADPTQQRERPDHSPVSDEPNAPAPLAPIIWAMDPDARGKMREHVHRCSSFVALWNCPVCERPVPRRRRPGRHRVYCTNACRQRAYRLRCAERDRQIMRLVRDPRPERATTRDRVHAIREFADPSSGRRDSLGRGITMCGAFARMAPDTPERFSHTRFHVTDSPGAPTCDRCAELSHIAPRPLASIVAEVLALDRANRPDHTPRAA